MVVPSNLVENVKCNTCEKSIGEQLNCCVIKVCHFCQCLACVEIIPPTNVLFDCPRHLHHIIQLFNKSPHGFSGV